MDYSSGCIDCVRADAMHLANETSSCSKRALS
eukprot:SAG11_NODE_37130_length_258_cov_0.830189_1_plen_31_part_10